MRGDRLYGRREALRLMIAGLGAYAWPPEPTDSRELSAWLQRFRNPPREYTVIPFWFWNDELNDNEIRRQIDDFAAHGVYGFVIHPRIGLPESIGFMSEEYLHFVKLAVDYAASKRMIVHLYDEGMYPSGSASGQVVRDNPAFAARCLIFRELQGDAPRLEPGENAVAVRTLDDGKRIVLIDAPSRGKIRGIHFGEDDGEPAQPPAADLLNPEATRSFIDHVHERYFRAVGKHFGKTVRAIFTDEPDLLGRRHRPNAQPWTTGLEKELRKIMGADVVPRLPELWFSRGPESARFRADFQRAVNRRLEETYYAPLSRWCERHHVALTGHPAGPGDIGVQRYFQIPGQDIVWRYVEPGKPSAIEGDQSVTAKCSSSAAAHLGRKRNGNEVFGAYGWNFTYDEMEWLTNWLFVRGVNQITPHAFYYSLRGKRRDERPPDVGPNSSWWARYRQYADCARRMSWLLAESLPVVRVAILGNSDRLPWRAASICYRNQIDFDYLEDRLLLDGSARVSADGVRIRNAQYDVVILEDVEEVDSLAIKALEPLTRSGGVITYSKDSSDEDGLVAKVRALVPGDVRLHGGEPAAQAGIRIRHMRQGKWHIYLMFNEGEREFDGAVALPKAGERRWLVNPAAAELLEPLREPAPVRIAAHQALLIVATRTDAEQ